MPYDFELSLEGVPDKRQMHLGLPSIRERPTMPKRPQEKQHPRVRRRHRRNVSRVTRNQSGGNDMKATPIDQYPVLPIG